MDLGTGRPVWALGFMSGTSMDGVDAALVLTDGEEVSVFGPTGFEPFDPGFKASLAALMAREPPVTRASIPADCGDENVFLASENLEGFHHRAYRSIALSGPTPQVIGMHGQTIHHAPRKAFTVQIGWGDRLARIVGVPVVWDFRQQDVEAGGEGAPLVPFFHFAIAKRIGAVEPLAFLNVGGVANVTWVDPAKAAPSREGACLAFDTGPGNALVNDWMEARAGRAMDEGGAAAAAGRVHRDRLASNAAADYLARRPPKSLDRNAFAPVLAAMAGLSVEDGAATLTAFTAECVAEAQRHMPVPPARWLVCGGGRKNATLMRMLAGRLAAPVAPVEAVGLDGDMLEAQAFAYLAVRVLRGLPTSAPGTTGCREPVSGGRVAYP